ncbi:MAG: Arc family DNA-binding protein [Gemmatimonadetes bacterium]|nr:Arc family DNA-binding protein [Gemmatimonadota bacterium]
MPVNLSIKNVPDDLAERLRAEATRNHRSMQGQMMAILEDALAPEHRLTALQVRERVARFGLSTADEATEIVRADRDAR